MSKVPHQNNRILALCILPSCPRFRKFSGTALSVEDRLQVRDDLRGGENGVLEALHRDSSGHSSSAGLAGPETLPRALFPRLFKFWSLSFRPGNLGDKDSGRKRLARPRIGKSLGGGLFPPAGMGQPCLPECPFPSAMSKKKNNERIRLLGHDLFHATRALMQTNAMRR